MREAPDSVLDPLRLLIVPAFEGAADAGHALIERRNTAQPAETQALAVVRLSALVDRLADAKRRLQEVLTVPQRTWKLNVSSGFSSW